MKLFPQHTVIPPADTYSPSIHLFLQDTVTPTSYPSIQLNPPAHTYSHSIPLFVQDTVTPTSHPSIQLFPHHTGIPPGRCYFFQETAVLHPIPSLLQVNICPVFGQQTWVSLSKTWVSLIKTWVSRIKTWVSLSKTWVSLIRTWVSLSKTWGFPSKRMYPLRSLCTLYLPTRHVGVPVGASGLCCVHVTSFER